MCSPIVVVLAWNANMCMELVYTGCVMKVDLVIMRVFWHVFEKIVSNAILDFE